MIDFKEEAKVIEELRSNRTYLQKKFDEVEIHVSKAQEKLLSSKLAREVLQGIAQSVQQQAHARISEVVSSCLSTVFDDPYEFKIEFAQKRGRTEAQLMFVREDVCVDPLTASGGGVVDTAAFALRVACLVLHRPRLSRIVVMDEPFKFVSEEYRANIRTMMEKLSEELGLQIIMISHINELETGKIIEL